MKSTIRVCVVYSRDLAGMPRVTHGSVNFREPQPGREYPQTAKTAINGRRVNNNGNEKSEHILFYNFYFQKKYKKNATKAIRNTQIGCLTVMIVCSLIER